MLLPLLLLMDDDALVFWCFVALMQRLDMRLNFSVDERGIFHQLQLLGQVMELTELSDLSVWLWMSTTVQVACGFTSVQIQL